MAHFVEQWEKLTDSKWVLSIVRKGFRIPFRLIPPLSSVPIKLSQSSSLLLRGEIDILLQKQAVEWVQIRELPIFIPGYSLYQKRTESTSSLRPFFAEPIHKEAVIQDGDSQVSKTVDCEQ